MDESVVSQSAPLAQTGSAPVAGDGVQSGDVTSQAGQDNQANVQQMIPASDFQKFQSLMDQKLTARDRQIQQLESRFQQTQTQQTLQQQFETRATELYYQYLKEGKSDDYAQRAAAYHAEREVTDAAERRELQDRLSRYEQQEQQAQTLQSLEQFGADVAQQYGLTDDQLAQATSHLSYRDPQFQHKVHLAVRNYLGQQQQIQQGNVGLRNDLRFAQPGSSSPVSNTFQLPPGVKRGTAAAEQALKEARAQSRRNG